MNGNNFDIQKIVNALEDKRREASKEYDNELSILNARYEEKQNVIDDILNILGCSCYQKDPMLVKVQSGENNSDKYAICPKCNKALGLYVGGTSDYKDMNFCCHCGQLLCWEE